jgi:hypothetical protein
MKSIRQIIVPAFFLLFSITNALKIGWEGRFDVGGKQVLAAKIPRNDD